VLYESSGSVTTVGVGGILVTVHVGIRYTRHGGGIASAVSKIRRAAAIYASKGMAQGLLRTSSGLAHAQVEAVTVYV
jgi:hypothetical protein